MTERNAGPSASPLPPRGDSSALFAPITRVWSAIMTCHQFCREGRACEYEECRQGGSMKGRWGVNDLDPTAVLLVSPSCIALALSYCLRACRLGGGGGGGGAIRCLRPAFASWHVAHPQSCHRCFLRSNVKAHLPTPAVTLAWSRFPLFRPPGSGRASDLARFASSSPLPLFYFSLLCPLVSA